MMETSQIPEEIALSRDRLMLVFTWNRSHGESPARRAILSSETLRLACRCAWCSRDRILACFPPDFPGVAIEKVVPIGNHALHIAFSDGHARGIFPWPYLDQIAAGKTFSEILHDNPSTKIPPAQASDRI